MTMTEEYKAQYYALSDEIKKINKRREAERDAASEKADAAIKIIQDKQDIILRNA